MNIHELEEKIECMTDTKYVAVIELIIDAVRDYPVVNLRDTSAFFDIVRKSLCGNEVSIPTLAAHIDILSKSADQTTIWKITSLTSLLESFKLMEMYGFSFQDVIRKIED